MSVVVIVALRGYHPTSALKKKKELYCIHYWRRKTCKTCKTISHTILILVLVLVRIWYFHLGLLLVLGLLVVFVQQQQKDLE